jgi:hypothetical protein
MIDFEALTRPLDQVDYRPGRPGLNLDGSPFLPLLAYIDARDVQKRLDEVVGPAGWSTRVIRLVDGGGFVCELSLEVEPGKWVTKASAAGDTEYEEVKGGDSRAFVRAASAWGIGRYLYDSPRVYAEFVPKGTLRARRIEINNREFYYLFPDVQVAERSVENAATPAPEGLRTRPIERPRAENYPSPFARPQQAAMAPSKVTRRAPARDDDPGSFIAKFGGLKKPLREYTPDEINTLRVWLSRLVNPKSSAVRLKERLEAFLGEPIAART